MHAARTAPREELIPAVVEHRGRRALSAAERAVIFLDVDGVLNRFPGLGSVPRRADEFDDFRTARCNGFPITFSAKMGQRLERLDAQIVWATTWEHDDLANKEIAPLFGWPRLPVLHRGDHDERAGRFGWWKASAVQAYLEEHPRPFVWIDDDLAASVAGGDVAWLATCEQPRLLVSPELGLLPSQLDEIERFLDELGCAPPSDPAG